MSTELPGAAPADVVATARGGAGPVAEGYEQQAPAVQMMPGNLEAIVSDLVLTDRVELRVERACANHRSQSKLECYSRSFVLCLSPFRLMAGCHFSDPPSDYSQDGVVIREVTQASQLLGYH